MKFLSYGKDGGSKSTVTGFWFIEIKWLFSIVLLRFDEGSREAFHTHAFNALTWWLKGEVEEFYQEGGSKTWTPSVVPKFTPRRCFHKVFAKKTTYAISFRGPWESLWKEYLPKENKTIIMTHGRQIVAEQKW